MGGKGRPNILLITTDSQRCDTLSCMGSQFAISPNLDKLAAEGVLFNNAHTSSPVCSPARCSLITGVHTPIHGCIENGIERKTHLPLFPDLLKEQGYTNIMVGKTHFGPVPESFDRQHLVMRKSKDEDDVYAEFIRSHGYERKSSHPNPIPEDLFIESFLIDTTINEIEKVISEDKGPFFAFCSLISPHEPVDPPGKWASLYDDISLPPINYTEGEIRKIPDPLEKLLGFRNYSEEKCDLNHFRQEDLYEAHGSVYHEDLQQKIDQLRRLYYGLSSYCDDQIGRLIRFLDESGLRENTLIIFTSDHGLQLFDHGFNDKHTYYDSSWRVPLIISMPGTLPIGEKRDFAMWNDIPVTILGAAGTSCDTMQGFDLFTPLSQGDVSPRKCAVGTLYKSAALATKRWKIEYYFEIGSGRLFDRINDPLEQDDLFDKKDYQEIKNELLTALLTWRSDLVDLKELVDSTVGGAPVAMRVASYSKQLKGSDTEQRLNEWAEKIDEMS